MPSRFVLEFDWLGLRSDEDTWSGSEVNRLISEVLVEGFPAVDFSHGDLTRGEQRSEQHAAVSAEGSTVCVLMRRLNSSWSLSIALVVRAL